MTHCQNGVDLMMMMHCHENVGSLDYWQKIAASTLDVEVVASTLEVEVAAIVEVVEVRGEQHQKPKVTETFAAELLKQYLR